MDQDARAATNDGNEEFDARCQQWIREMSRGNERALGELFDATLDRVFGVAIRIVGDATLAEDVVADVFHDAWRNAARYDPNRGRPLTWLLTICRNRALDEIRHEASMARKAESAAARETPASMPGPDDLLESVEAGHAIHSLLLTVSSDDRQLLALAYFKGFSHQQIADQTGLPLGTVKSRIRRVLLTLGEVAPAGMQENYRHGG